MTGSVNVSMTRSEADRLYLGLCTLIDFARQSGFSMPVAELAGVDSFLRELGAAVGSAYHGCGS